MNTLTFCLATVNTLIFCLVTVNTLTFCLNYNSEHTHLLSYNSEHTHLLSLRQWTHSSFIHKGYSAIAKVCLDDSEHTFCLMTVNTLTFCLSTVNTLTFCLNYDSEHTHLLSYNSECIHLLLVRAILPLLKSLSQQWTHSPSVLIMTVNTLIFCLTKVNTLTFCRWGLSCHCQSPSWWQRTHSPFVGEGYPAIAKVRLDDSEHTHLLSVRAILPLPKSVLTRAETLRMHSSDLRLPSGTASLLHCFSFSSYARRTISSV